MKKPLFFALFSGLLFGNYSTLCSQSAEICRQVVASAGGSSSASGKTLEFTVGESIISTLFNGDFQLTQGFHQPEICPLTVSAYEPAWDGVLFIYPNPTSQNLFLTVLQPSLKGQTLHINIVNVLGQVVLQQTAVTDQETLIDCGLLASGHYFLSAWHQDRIVFSSMFIVE